ncbi:uncharacterized protein AB675_481 [Cyphellophora attinorum]|uniref:Meiotically up-regulated protein n=1 Tax=Cyphellophora attinorum TaxID=1664694 RepID=A0A0N1HC00_9EURO|nr:uncharacterized protein AB675_481 [Phialophora attinorum]KPI45850.1 hypothetical protein AB675_481 [Phialophora attinorum]
MNGLVAYDSSSDEDAPAAPSTSGSAVQPKHDAKEVVSSVDQPAASAQNESSLSLIGPMMPTQALESFDNGLDNLPEEISEQDLIRHLTQAAHPVTEIPPSPPGSPDPATETRFKNFLALKAQGLHFNEDLAKKSSFRNPALFATLLEKNGLDSSAQYASTLPLSVWDPQSLPAYGYKEELARSQQSLRDREAARKKQAMAAGKRTIEFAAASSPANSSKASTPDAFRRTAGT